MGILTLEATLKRHGYYCRSRKTEPVARSRSCIACAKRKARCDHARPSCARCIVKGIDCSYPANARTPKVKAPASEQSVDASSEGNLLDSTLGTDYSGVVDHGGAGDNVDVVLDDATVPLDPELAKLEGEAFDWGYLDVNLNDFISVETADEAVQFPSSSKLSSSFLRSTPPVDETAQLQLQLQLQLQQQQAASLSQISIPTMPNYTPRSLIQRPKLKTGAHGIANLIFNTLKSYPRMMLQHNTLPPFIHPQLASSSAKSKEMEPLDNCISLVHMVSGEVRSNQKLFWRNVRQECERLCEVYSELSTWELLSAMQALSIYIIMRLDQGETEHNNFDYLLLAAVRVVAKRFNDITAKEQSVICGHRQQGWHDWVFEESKRRLCIIYQVVNMVVYFEPASMCSLQSDLVLAPMPAKKQLWEANDSFAWKAESERFSGSHVDFGLTAKGELVKLEEGQVGCGDEVLLYEPLGQGDSARSRANWEEWCSGMDGLGGLVMLAASLVA